MSFLAKDFFVKRNVQIIKDVQELHSKEGINIRAAMAEIAAKYEVSLKTVDAVMYTEGYSHRAEAWAIVNEELKKEKEATKEVA
tara:strand:- start:6 stop:257 length:252 start_codon:yes stop_codon:yes gene_type:complete